MIKQAVLLVGGLGTRLGERTRETPKPLLEVGGRPFLAWTLDELRRFGVSDLVLLAGFRGERIAEILGSAPDMRVLIEPEPLGTGGALRFAADQLDQRFFLLNGDSWFDVNLWDLARGAEAADATLAVRPVEDLSRYGQVVLEGERICAFQARAQASGPGFINAGVGVLSRQVVDRIAPGAAVSIEAGIYPRLAAEGRLRGRSYDAAFIDIGVPEDFERAQQFIPALMTRGRVLLDPGLVFEPPLASGEASPRVWGSDSLMAVKAVNDAGLLAMLTSEAGPGLAAFNAALTPHGAHLDGVVTGAAFSGVGSPLRSVQARGSILITDGFGRAAQARSLGIEVVMGRRGAVHGAVTKAVALLMDRQGS